MKKIILTIILLIVSGFFWCTHQPKTFYLADQKYIHYVGRIDFSNPRKPRISGAGSYLQCKFRGNACDIFVEDQNLNNHHNYLAIVIDGKYLGRLRLNKNQITYSLAQNLKDTVHSLLVSKATESQIGYVDLSGVSCEGILPFEKPEKRRIEFIGNSITCGSGLDISDIPCDSAEWYDQHNAYLSYGPIVARNLNADWLLSAVSGIGITRSWNSPGPTMPEVYEQLYLNADSLPLWEVSRFIPDLVSINLGTNDFSEGDGSYRRAELDSTEFLNDYIQFIRLIRRRYPQAQICCLSSPVFSGEKNIRLTNYLSVVVQYMNKVEKDHKVHLFRFSDSYNHGCSGHPDQTEHQKMAQELLPFFERIMDW